MHLGVGFVALGLGAALLAAEAVPEPDGAVGPTHEGQQSFEPLFNGRDLAGWAGALKGYAAKDGILFSRPAGGRIWAEEDYGDFVLRFEFKLSPDSNSGVTIRTPPGGEGAKDGMEIQILDDTSPLYKSMPGWYKHGSIFGVAPARTGHLRPVGEWNEQEITAQGSRVVVKLNGTTILDADLAAIIESGKTADGQGAGARPGLQRKAGRIGFIGTGPKVEFRNLRVKRLSS